MQSCRESLVGFCPHYSASKTDPMFLRASLYSSIFPVPRSLSIVSLWRHVCVCLFCTFCSLRSVHQLTHACLSPARWLWLFNIAKKLKDKKKIVGATHGLAARLAGRLKTWLSAGGQLAASWRPAGPSLLYLQCSLCGRAGRLRAESSGTGTVDAEMAFVLHWLVFAN